MCDKKQGKQHLNTFRVLKNKVNAPFVGPPKSKKFPNGIKVLYKCIILLMIHEIMTTYLVWNVLQPMWREEMEGCWIPPLRNGVLSEWEVQNLLK